MNLGLAGRTALVLASTSGLGRAVAEALAGEGAAVHFYRGESVVESAENDVAAFALVALAMGASALVLQRWGEETHPRLNPQG